MIRYALGLGLMLAMVTVAGCNSTCGQCGVQHRKKPCNIAAAKHVGQPPIALPDHAPVAPGSGCASCDN